MSADRDKSQKIAFVYNNFYELYKKGQKAQTEKAAAFTRATPQNTPAVHETSRVLRIGETRPGTSASTIEIRSYQPMELMGKRLELAAAKEALTHATLAPARPAQNSSESPLQSLKSNLKNLTDLHQRLQFMLRELEDLVKDTKN